MTKNQMQQVLAALTAVEALIEHQYTGSREAMNALQNAADNAHGAIAIMQAAVDAPEVEPKPIEYLLDGARVKLNFNKAGNMTSLQNMHHELQGRWVSFVAAENDRHLKAAPQERKPQEDVCEWTQDQDFYMGDTYQSACGESWSFIDGGPTENRVRFCQGCGKPVKSAPTKDTP